MGDRSDSDVGKTKGNSSLPPFNAVFVPERELPEPALYGLDDLTSNIALLCLETVLQRKSIIVFCNSKRNCEIQAAIIAKVIFHYQKNDQGGNTHHNVEKQSKHGNTVEGGNPGIGTPAPRLSPTELRDLRRNRLLLMESLRQTQAGLHSDLRVPLQYGVAFHHAGLMGEQRKLIEEAFHNNVIRVICATSTLAAGVNLPANRVIVTSLRTGREPLTVASFRQMVGRAGRKGLDEYGEAFLLIRPDASTPGTPIVEDGQAAVEYVTGEMLPLHSSIVLGKGGGLEKLLLDTIYFGSLPHNLDHENNLPCISSWKDVHAFVGCTLFSQQNASAGENGLARVQECTVRALQFLWKYTFLLHVDSTFQYNTNTGTTTSRAELASSKDSKDVEDIKDVEGSMNSSQSRDSTTSLKPNGFWPSSLGKATVLSGIPPHEAVQTIRYLEQAKDNLILTGNVQPLFLLTPPINRIVVPWTEYANIYQALLVACPEVEEPATHIGINRARLIRYQQMPPTRSIDQAKEETLLDTRFYATMVLLCVLNEKPIHSIVDMMNISAADIHFLRTQASLFCRINVTFCRALNWPLLAAVLEAFTDNLHFGVQEELLPLMRIGTQYMHIQRAKNLYKHGIKSVLDIIAAPDDLLVHILMGEVSFDGKRVIQVNLVSANGKRKVDGSTTKASKDDQGTDIINSHHKENREALSRAELITSCSRLCATLKTRAAKYIEEENRLHRMLGAVC